VPYLACSVLSMPDLARAVAPTARGACPSSHRPFVEADGLLVRVRVPGGELTCGQASTMARMAERHGSGVVEVTSRANLQIRGVRAEALATLQAGLSAAALVPADAATDERRNIVAAPAAGLDPTEVADVRPVAQSLLRLLSGRDLPPFHPKAGALIDGGGAVSLRGRRHDVALGAARRRDTGAIVAELVLGGPLPLDPDPASLAPVVPWATAAPVAFHALALTAGLRRVHEVVAGRGLGAVVAELERRSGVTMEPVPRRVLDRATPHLAAPLGIHPAGGPQRSRRPSGSGRATVFVGAAPLLGRLDATALDGVAEIGRRHGDGTIRLTSWRTVLVPGVPSDQAPAVLAELAGLGLVTDPEDPATTVVACVGRAGCQAGLADTLVDAHRLIAGRRNGTRRSPGQTPTPAPAPTVHLSGCGKRCASRQVKDVTLVAAGGDRYDVYVRDPATGSERLAGPAVPADEALRDAAAGTGARG
jgi:precorrin-3B synthase